jgi:small nuclear ribonucleoprotein (snRNP)-like protein
MGDNDDGRRPLDVLDKAKGDRVMAELKDGATVSGELEAFDLHLNMWLKNASMTTDEGQTDYGKLLIRGDNVIVVSPEN